eukprot:5257261-Amphidinium_carterae.1
MGILFLWRVLGVITLETRYPLSATKGSTLQDPATDSGVLCRGLARLRLRSCVLAPGQTLLNDLSHSASHHFKQGCTLQTSSSKHSDRKEVSAVM